MPVSKPMPDIGKGCHELRIKNFWRVPYMITPTEIVVLEVFPKKSQKMPLSEINTCKLRIKAYNNKKAQEMKNNKTASIGECYIKVYKTAHEHFGMTKAEYKAYTKTASYKLHHALISSASDLYHIAKVTRNKETKAKLNKIIYNLGAASML